VPCKLLDALVEAGVSTEDNIDYVGGLLEALLARWILFFIILLTLLPLIFIEWRGIEGFSEVDALKDRVL
jgi:hypothetical protein